MLLFPSPLFRIRDARLVAESGSSSLRLARTSNQRHEPPHATFVLCRDVKLRLLHSRADLILAISCCSEALHYLSEAGLHHSTYALRNSVKTEVQPHLHWFRCALLPVADMNRGSRFQRSKEDFESCSLRILYAESNLDLSNYPMSLLQQAAISRLRPNAASTFKLHWRLLVIAINVTCIIPQNASSFSLAPWLNVRSRCGF
jgi:hypothetical protein